MDNNLNSQGRITRERSPIQTILSISIILILVLGLGVSIYLVGRKVFFQSRATGGVAFPETGTLGGGVVSPENSYIFASPLRAGVGGEKIRVTVFVLDGNGKGVIGKNVVLGQNPALTIVQVQPVTDQTGRAVFDASSSSAGLFAVEASFDDQTIPQRVQLLFE